MGKKRRPKKAARNPQPREAPAAPGPVAESAPDLLSEKADGPEGSDPEAEVASASAPRRAFLLTSARVAVGGSGLLVLAGALRTAVPDFSSAPPTRFPLGPVSEFKRGTLTWLRQSQLFVLHDDDGVGVFSSRCTHLGCVLRRTPDGFTCPCHGAHFDRVGKVLSGPARRDLPWYVTWVDEDGRLWVDRGS